MSLKSALIYTSPAIFVLLWSTGFIGAKLGAPWSNPFSFLLVRVVIVALILGVVCGISKVRWPGVQPALHSAVVGILVHGVYLGGIFWAIDKGMPAGISAIIVGLQPLLTAIIARYSLKEVLNVRHWIGFFIGIGGLILVLQPKFQLTGTGITFAATLVCLMSVIGMTIGTIYQKKFVPNIDVRVGTFFQYLGTIPLMAIGVGIDGGYYIEWTGEFIFALGWLVFVLSIGAISLLMILIRHGAVSRIASLFYLVPVATTIEGYFLFGETLTIIQLLGMLVVIGAVTLARQQPQSEKQS